ncbi:PREDICTED: kin of IRRE-like protein 2 [Rhinopithecus bieti]|uniref:kin of IRRE-like protein 2 n=1 Tax=Rhinopithecus bieti TaxID=61621 RepID=UPI00083C0E93|nr:PREDICTED: kin of IRRE-like protein 2 [Rhinopithecus bieti]
MSPLLPADLLPTVRIVAGVAAATTTLLMVITGVALCCWRHGKASASFSEQKNLMRIPGSSDGCSSRGPEEEETGSREDRVGCQGLQTRLCFQTQIVAQSQEGPQIQTGL